MKPNSIVNKCSFLGYYPKICDIYVLIDLVYTDEIIMIRKAYKFSSILLSAYLLCITIAHAQSSLPSHTIHLKSGVISTISNSAEWINNRGNKTSAEQVLLHFDKKPNSTSLDSLSRAGITVLDYIPDNTYVAIVSQLSDRAKRALSLSYSITPMLPEWKADKYLWQSVTTGNLKLVVSIYSVVGKQELQDLVRSLDGQLLAGDMEDYGYYNIDIAAQKLRNLAGWYGIRSISMRTKPVLLDRQSIPAVKGNNAIAPFLLGGYNLNGDSVTIGVGDNTSGIFHTDMVDRITNYNPAPMTNHGIHINGIAGGAAILDPLAISMTPKVKLLNFFFSSLLPATGTMLAQHNMTITNNSYTIAEDNCPYFGTYDLYSRFLDTMAIQYPTVQHVFAAGNDGELTCAPHAPGYATVGGGYQPSKNIIVVGSTSHNLVQAWDQSRGPVKDGRIKPDIVAVGASVYSGLRNNTYGWAGGTSMASPQVASGLAILTQRYKQLHNGTQPRADLLKTVLLNSSTDLGVAGPDFSFGFGMMDIGRALKTLENNWYRSGILNHSDSQSYVINIPTGTAQAKIMLYWNDAPASPSAAKQLVNDLDVVLKLPNGQIKLPLVPDATPANAQKPAIEQADHLNNVEQITINNPESGNYTVTVRGYDVSLGPQPFVIAYDLAPVSLSLTFPLGGEQATDVDSFRVFWQAITDGNTCKVEFSKDNGSTWVTMANAVPAEKRYFSWIPEGVSSGNCLVRVSRNNTTQVSTSQRFVINPKPKLSLAITQCPGYMNVHWSPIPGANAYAVLKKIGAEMLVIDTTTDTNYVFVGLSLHNRTYVAVQPIMNGLSGYRSIALSGIANNGDCQLAATSGDLMIDTISGPESGRMFTSSAIQAGKTIKVGIRNLYNTDCGSYTLSWQINNGTWQQLINPGYTIRANSTTYLDLPGLDFSLAGNYTLKIAIHNTSVPDPHSSNDTVIKNIKCLPNDPMDLTHLYEDGFEDMLLFNTTHDSIGISPNGHWDYFNEDDSGRIRSYIYDKIVIKGNRSVSMDQFMPMRSGSNNLFSGTFNLSSYDTGLHEIRIDYDYILHSIPNNKNGNAVFARATDTSAWKTIYNYDSNSYPGTLKQVKSISITDIVRHSNQNFSTSTQIAFGQNDTTIIASTNFGTGITIDNFRMYTVANDAVLADVVAPIPNNCGLPSSIPLTVKVKNGVNYTIKNISVYYALDNGIVYQGTIDSLKSKDSINYTFTQSMDITTGSKHSIKIWISAASDTYSDNDSIINYQFLNSKIITDYPYLEQFEKDNGGFYTDGFMSSWQYGAPSSTRINKAASGKKAWKTNLTGNHNDLEESYLYSPCFDLSAMSQPMLSFSMAEDIENCGSILCDGAYLEYSYDGNLWTKIDANSNTTNWYDSTHHIWNTAGFSRWHVVSVPLPVPPASKVLHLRFVFFSDPAVAYEGVAIDDIHIYDKNKDILAANGQTTIQNDQSANTWNVFATNNLLAAEVQPTQYFNNISISLYQIDTLYNHGQTQYLIPRSYALYTEQESSDSFVVRLFLTEQDILKITTDTTCPSCTRIEDAYTLGITQYVDNQKNNTVNGTLNDNFTGTTRYYNSEKVNWVPYMSGYRAEARIKDLGELWFNNGGPTNAFVAGDDYLNFIAFKKGAYATAFWHSLIDTAVNQYVLESSIDNIMFTEVATIIARNDNPGEYTVTATEELSSTVYFRLKWTMKNSTTLHYSPVRKIEQNEETEGGVKFNASMASSNHVLTKWQSFIDGMVKNYLLERAINDDSYTEIANVSSEKNYGQLYYITDAPANIHPGAVLSYKLTAVLNDNSKVTLPVQKVKWIDRIALSEIYPNPTSNDKISIHWFADPGTEMKVSIYDITGRFIEQYTLTATEWDNTTTLTTIPKTKSVYFVKATSSNYTNTFKVIFK